MTLRSFSQVERELKRLDRALGLLDEEDRLIRQKLASATGVSSPNFWISPTGSGGAIVAGDGLAGGGPLPGIINLSVDVTAIIDTAYGLTESSNNIRINIGDGLEFDAGALEVDLSAVSGLEFFAGDLQIDDNIAGDGLSISSKILEVDYSAPSFTLGTANAEGAGRSTIRADATIAIFDVVVPTTIVVGATAATGSATVAPRRDHAHGITTSSNPGAAATILASDVSGYLQLVGLGIGVAAGAANRITIVDGGTIGQAAGPLLTFDDTLGYLEITGCAVGIGTSSPDRLLHSELDDASVDTVLYPLRVTRTTSGTATHLMGAGIEYELENNVGVNFIAGTIDVRWKNAISEWAELAIWLCDGGVLQERAVFVGSETVVTGNPRGYGATDLQSQRSAATQIASGSHSVIIGGSRSTASGQWSFAKGRQAQAVHDGAHIWADFLAVNFNSIAQNEFAIRARGGFRHAYDNSNYWTAQVSSAGAVTFNATGTGAGFTFSDLVTCTVGLRTLTVTDDVSDPPTDAELDTAFGTPATVGEGFIGLIDDNNAETAVWLCVAIGSSWWYSQLTMAA